MRNACTVGLLVIGIGFASPVASQPLIEYGVVDTASGFNFVESSDSASSGTLGEVLPFFSNGSAILSSAEVGFGSIRTRAWLQHDAALGEANNGHFTVANAAWRDIVTITSSPDLDGKNGSFTALVRFEGSLTTLRPPFPVWGGGSFATTSADLIITATTQAPPLEGTDSLSADCVSGAGPECVRQGDAFGTYALGPFPFVYGTSFELEVRAIAHATLRSLSIDLDGIGNAEADLARTVGWRGIAEVVDESTGLAVADFDVVSASGVDWAGPALQGDVVRNGEFGVDLGGWSLASPTDSQIEWSPLDVSSLPIPPIPASGSALLSNLQGVVTDVSAMVQCVAVEPDTPFEISAWVNIPSGQSGAGSPFVAVAWHGESRCGGPSTFAGNTAPVPQGFDQWEFVSFSATTPQTAKSALVAPSIQVATPGGISAHFDAVRVVPEPSSRFLYGWALAATLTLARLRRC